MLDRSNDTLLRARAARVIPNGMYGHESTRLLPASFPQFFERGEGAYVWDADGRRYLDYMGAWGPNLLGYRHPAIDAAAAHQMTFGDTLTGPTALMVELAETLVGMISHADWAMFCKNGTDATTMAVTIARAQTGRRRVLVAEHAYHGAAPWCTPVAAGILPENRAHFHTYQYNDAASLEAAVRDAGDDLAAIFATPFKHDVFMDQAELDPEYARAARRLCDETGAMLVVDDVRGGFRISRDCSWSLVGVEPDLSSWGKALANGHPISVLLGSDRCREGAAAIFVTGSFWFAAAPMAASLATLKILRDSDYLERTIALGERLRAGLARVSEANGFTLRQSGPVQMPMIMFGDDPDMRVGFAWAEAMLARGFYVHPWHNMFICAAMTEADIDATITAADAALAEVRGKLSTLQPHALLMAMFGQHGGEGAVIEELETVG